MAKSRAKRKAERKRREQTRQEQTKAQARTQVPESGSVAEVEAVIETGADVADYGETVREPRRAADTPITEATDATAASEAIELEAAAATELEAAAATDLEAPAPSRADVGAPEQGLSRRERRRLEREQERRAKESAERRKPQEREERRRGPVRSFFVSVVRELQRVQWPDRETLIQASAVTVIFVAILAAYLGGLDALFSRLVQLVI
jgi:preprotein translocase SecE subunit